MKPTAVASASVAAVLSYINPLLGFLFVFFFALFFSTMGVLKSWAAHLRLANDAPNALRALLAAAGGALLPFGAQFLLQSTGVFLILGAVFLNDEYQRRVFAAAGRGKRGGTVALLGIDGSGKSTHAEALGSWFSARGYEYSNVPFHRYLFVGAFARSASGDLESKGRRRGGNPLRPVLSLIDNLALHLVTAFGVGLEGKVVVFDRYIWSTYVKYASLGYPVRPLRRLYLLPRPSVALVLDVPVSKSLGVIGGRARHIRYQPEILADEREEYLRIARARGYTVIDATKPFEEVQSEMERVLSGAFAG